MVDSGSGQWGSEIGAKIIYLQSSLDVMCLTCNRHKRKGGQHRDKRWQLVHDKQLRDRRWQLVRDKQQQLGHGRPKVRGRLGLKIHGNFKTHVCDTCRETHQQRRLEHGQWDQGCWCSQYGSQMTGCGLCWRLCCMTKECSKHPGKEIVRRLNNDSRVSWTFTTYTDGLVGLDSDRMVIARDDCVWDSDAGCENNDQFERHLELVAITVSAKSELLHFNWIKCRFIVFPESVPRLCAPLIKIFSLRL